MPWLLWRQPAFRRLNSQQEQWSTKRNWRSARDADMQWKRRTEPASGYRLSADDTPGGNHAFGDLELLSGPLFEESITIEVACPGYCGNPRVREATGPERPMFMVWRQPKPRHRGLRKRTLSHPCSSSGG